MGKVYIPDTIEAAKFAAELVRQGIAFRCQENGGSYTFELTGF